MAAFRLAVEQCVDGIELDVKLSADDKAVVIHDHTLERTTDGRGKVNQHTLDALKRLDAGSKFDNRFAGEKIPTLDEVIEEIGKDICINIELTNYTSQNDDLIAVVADIVKRHPLVAGIMFSSFSWTNIRKIKQLLPHYPVGLLASGGWMGTLARSRFFLQLSSQYIHPRFDDVNESMMEREKARGRLVNVWTVNEDDDIKRMIDLGVNMIMTDDPLKAINIVERK
jgi:glycerophosphoryl diester phosphodiesterase